jgi:hypothetical protein
MQIAGITDNLGPRSCSIEIEEAIEGIFSTTFRDVVEVHPSFRIPSTRVLLACYACTCSVLLPAFSRRGVPILPFPFRWAAASTLWSVCAVLFTVAGTAFALPSFALAVLRNRCIVFVVVRLRTWGTDVGLAFETTAGVRCSCGLLGRVFGMWSVFVLQEDLWLVLSQPVVNAVGIPHGEVFLGG